MKLFFSLFTLLLFITTVPTQAQTTEKQYLDNTLIIKFKTIQDATEYKNKSIASSSIFNEFGIQTTRPVFTAEAELAFKDNMRAKGKVVPGIATDELRKIYTASFDAQIDAKVLAAKISNLPGIEYAEPRYLYYTAETTVDPIKNNFITFHRFNSAWDVSQSSSDIIISIVDSGVNYGHEDLQDKHWVNTAEIPNNGIDEDRNGFVDDFLGWDFWESGYTAATMTQDNDPFAGNNDHGTHVAGIATATPNNNKGLAGTGYNARYMAVKAGGAPDNPATAGNESRSIGFGYDAILYSMVNGADIINCSWGGTNFSAFGEEVVNMANEAGILIVAASGNDTSDENHYPSSYRNVLSVGSVDLGGQISGFSNFGFTVDVFATGVINSSNGMGSNGYATYGGTSMASPAVAGLAALIKERYPTWSPERIKNQIRASSVTMENANPASFRYKLGTGYIDAYLAVNTPQPGIQIDTTEYLNSFGETLGIGEDGIVKMHLTNYGGESGPISVSVESLSDGVSFSSDAFPVASIATDETRIVEIPVSTTEDILETLSAEIVVKFVGTSSTYNNFEILTFDDLQFDISRANDLAVSFTPTGKIGFFDASAGVGGIGFIPDHQTANFSEDNVLFEGGIILEANKKIANSVRSLSGRTDNDFLPISSYKVTSLDATSAGDGSATFAPKKITTLDNAQVTLNTYAFNDAATSNAIILNYVITNTSNSYSLSDTYFGVFNDWDIGNFARNSTTYDAQNDVLIIRETEETGSPFVAVASFGNTSSVLAIDNNFSGGTSSFRFGLDDGFSDAEKRNSLKAGENNTELANADVSAVVATGPYYIPPRSSISVGFVYAFGDTELELLNQINAARSLNLFELSELNDRTENEFPDEIEIFQNYPNPFNPSTTISFTLDDPGAVELTIYNLLGQKVRTVVNSELQAGIHAYTVNFDQFSSGLYFATLNTGGSQKVIKLTLLK
ncbi:MAG: S8 family serine peptidase [Balneolaceae bacterium]